MKKLSNLFFLIVILSSTKVNAQTRNYDFEALYPIVLNINTPIINEKDYSFGYAYNYENYGDQFSIAVPFYKNFGFKGNYALKTNLMQNDIENSAYTLSLGYFKQLKAKSDSKQKKNDYIQYDKLGLSFNAFVGLKNFSNNFYFYNSITDYKAGKLFNKAKLKGQNFFSELSIHFNTDFFINFDYSIKFNLINFKRFNLNFDPGSDFLELIYFANQNDPFIVREQTLQVRLGSKFLQPYFAIIRNHKPKKFDDEYLYDRAFNNSGVYFGCIISDFQIFKKSTKVSSEVEK